MNSLPLSPGELDELVKRLLADEPHIRQMTRLWAVKAIQQLRAAGRLPALDALQLHRCKICGTRWLLWPDMIHGGGWNLLDRYQRPGACCDNVAMGEQIEHLRDFDLAGLRADPAPRQLQEKKDVVSRVDTSATTPTPGSTAKISTGDE